MKNTLLLITVFMAIIACSTTDPVDPFENQEPGTIRYTIDGVEYVLHQDDFNADTCFDACLVDEQIPWLIVKALNPADSSEIAIFTNEIFPGVYDLSEGVSTESNLCIKSGYYGFQGDELGDRFWSYGDLGGVGSLQLTQFDATTELTSGTFEYTAFKEDGSGQSVTITNGSFYMLELRNFTGCLSPYF